MKSNRSSVVRLLVVSMVAALLSPVSMSFAAVANYEVTSIKIRAADGLYGQDVTKGSGVKTGHIQDGAVTDSKIGGTISGSKITAGTITTTQIADSAVTDAKISGTISGSKLGVHGHNASDISGTINVSNLPVGNTAGTVAAGDHNHDSIYQKKYANVIVVAKSGGDFTDLAVALASISDASATNPYLVKIMPGVYQVSQSVWGKNYVDIEGSGQNITKITGTLAVGSGIIRLACNSELSNITVENTGYIGNSMSTVLAAASDNTAEPFDTVKISNVNVINTRIGSVNTGLSYLFVNMLLNNVNIDVVGTASYGIDTSNSITKANNVTISASGGIIANSATVTIKNSNIKADGGTAIQNNGGHSYLINSVVESGMFYGSPAVTCAGVLNAAYEFFPNTCP